jgi:hypothetical protein
MMKVCVSPILIGLTCCLAAQQVEYAQEMAHAKTALFTYSEEANTYFSKAEYAITLERYEKVIQYIQENHLSDPSCLLQAICGSMFCYDLLNQDSFAKAAFDELVCEVALLNESIEEIDWFKQSLIYPQFQKNSKRYSVSIEKIGLPEASSEENCQLQCNGYAVAAAYACSRVPSPAISFLCYGCIFGLEQVCLRCCKGQGFWENCVKGLRRLFNDPEHPENPASHPYE